MRAAGGAFRPQGWARSGVRTIDTELDAIAAQVRTAGPLELDEVAELLATVHRDGPGPAQTRLVEHHLQIALDEALARGDRGIDVVDLYQEGSVATIVAVAEYAARSTSASGLRAFVSRVVGVHLDQALEEAAIERQEQEAFVRDAQLYQMAEVAMRSRLGRAATVTELAGVLEWPEERIHIMAEQLQRARAMYDEDIVQYLDDDTEDEE
jgi:DNA-directed RNA polymerase specialized sigma subunit